MVEVVKLVEISYFYIEEKEYWIAPYLGSLKGKN
jgi:hypothetical protein